jgi:molecular chaperone GrpE
MAKGKSKKKAKTEVKNNNTKSATEKKSTTKIPDKELASKEDELQAKVDEINDKYLRLYSEFDNYRKRTSKEKLDLSKIATADLIVELLPVLDDFERAIQSVADVEDCNAVKEGVELIFNKLQGVMTKKGLKPIESIGQDFDTDFHEAITYIPAPEDKLKGKIVDEVEKGYTLNEKVIRFSKVVIGQ